MSQKDDQDILSEVQELICKALDDRLRQKLIELRGSILLQFTSNRIQPSSSRPPTPGTSSEIQITAKYWQSTHNCITLDQACNPEQLALNNTQDLKENGFLTRKVLQVDGLKEKVSIELQTGVSYYQEIKRSSEGITTVYNSKKKSHGGTNEALVILASQISSAQNLGDNLSDKYLQEQFDTLLKSSSQEKIYSNVEIRQENVRYIMEKLGFDKDILLNAGPTLLATKRHMGGIASQFLYYASGPTLGAMHLEDFKLNSANILLAGAPKIWVIVHPTDKCRFEEAFRATYKCDQYKCSHFVRHTYSLIPTELLDLWKIRYKVQVQRPGDIIITEVDAYHQVVNFGNNIAVAINFQSREYAEQSPSGLEWTFCSKEKCPTKEHFSAQAEYFERSITRQFTSDDCILGEEADKKTALRNSHSKRQYNQQSKYRKKPSSRRPDKSVWTPPESEDERDSSEESDLEKNCGTSGETNAGCLTHTSSSTARKSNVSIEEVDDASTDAEDNAGSNAEGNASSDEEGFEGVAVQSRPHVSLRLLGPSKPIPSIPKRKSPDDCIVAKRRKTDTSMRADEYEEIIKSIGSVECFCSLKRLRKDLMKRQHQLSSVSSYIAGTFSENLYPIVVSALQLSVTQKHTAALNKGGAALILAERYSKLKPQAEKQRMHLINSKRPTAGNVAEMTRQLVRDEIKKGCINDLCRTTIDETLGRAQQFESILYNGDRLLRLQETAKIPHWLLPFRHQLNAPIKDRLCINANFFGNKVMNGLEFTTFLDLFQQSRPYFTDDQILRTSVLLDFSKTIYLDKVEDDAVISTLLGYDKATNVTDAEQHKAGIIKLCEIVID